MLRVFRLRTIVEYVILDDISDSSAAHEEIISQYIKPINIIIN